MNIISKIQDINRKVAFLEKKNKKLKNNANELAFESEKKGNLIILRKKDLKRADRKQMWSRWTKNNNNKNIDGTKRTIVVKASLSSSWLCCILLKLFFY